MLPEALTRWQAMSVTPPYMSSYTMIAPPVPSEHARGFDCLSGHEMTATPFGTHQARSAGEAMTRMHAAMVNIAKQVNKATGNLLMSDPHFRLMLRLSIYASPADSILSTPDPASCQEGARSFRVAGEPASEALD